MRKLASIQVIDSLTPIKGADRIETARVLGWNVVVQKDLYEVGDKVVYFEIDSILPEREWSEFLRERHFKVKTIRLRKQISQGLCIPIGECCKKSHWLLPVGWDMTEELGVTKYDPEAAIENNSSGKKVIKFKWLLKSKLGRRIHAYFFPKEKKGWPEFIPKTDEERVQNIPKVGKNVAGKKMYYTEKLDGQSATYFYNLATKTFGVCSRNRSIYHRNKEANSWWSIADDLNLELTLKNWCEANNRSIAIQGEIVGPGIQKNHYKLDIKEFFLYGIYDIDQKKYFNIGEKLAWLEQNVHIMHIPIISFRQFPEDYDYVALADGQSTLGGMSREGVVVRAVEDDGHSFKAISNEYLMKEDM